MTAPSPARRSMIAKVHLGAKELALDEATRRDLMERVTGHRSAADCTDRQLGDVLDEYRRRGWKPAVVDGGQSARPRPAAARRSRANHPAAGKARAMWISLHQLGVIRDPSEAALEAFARRQLKVERLAWADQGLVYKLIEALKAMAERAGWEQGLDGWPAHLHVRVLKERLAAAQAKRLAASGVTFRIPAFGVQGCSQAQLENHIADLARQIRDLPEASRP